MLGFAPTATISLSSDAWQSLSQLFETAPGAALPMFRCWVNCSMAPSRGLSPQLLSIPLAVLAAVLLISRQRLGRLVQGTLNFRSGFQAQNFVPAAAAGNTGVCLFRQISAISWLHHSPPLCLKHSRHRRYWAKASLLGTTVALLKPWPASLSSSEQCSFVH